MNKTELVARIRELEAELRNREKLPPTRRTQTRIDWEQFGEENARLQARVAELEALLQRAIGFGLGGSWEHEAATMLEAREREASP